MLKTLIIKEIAYNELKLLFINVMWHQNILKSAIGIKKKQETKGRRKKG